MKPSSKQTPRARELASILDSDDELPDSYEDTSEVPAYLNDARFDHIRLPWLDNCNPINISKPQKTTPIIVSDVEESNRQLNNTDCSPNVKAVNRECKIIISKGVLTARDLFFVKSIEEHCTESTLIWFIDLLKNKAFPNRTPMSCLAGDIINDDYKTNDYDSFDRTNANYYFNLMVCK